MTIKIIGFVDDTTSRTNRFTSDEQPAISELIAEASADGQLWHDILTVCNQKLQLSKCSFRPIHYNFKPSGEPVLANDTTAPAQLLINDEDGRPVKIPHKACDKAEQYLGCHKTIDNQKQQQQKLQERCDDYAKVATSKELMRHNSIMRSIS